MKHFNPAPVAIPLHCLAIPGFKSNSNSAQRARRVAKREKLQRQGGRCLYCTEPLSVSKATVEHRKPLSRGGTDTADNIDAACRPCNKAKGRLTKREFLLAIFNPSLLRHPWPLYLACLDIRLRRRTELACRRLRSMIVRTEAA